MLDANGKFVMASAKVRARSTEEGKHKPFHFLDLHPEWALVYDWVAPEHKERALRLLHILDGSIKDTEGKSEGKSPVIKCDRTMLTLSKNSGTINERSDSSTARTKT